MSKTLSYRKGNPWGTCQRCDSDVRKSELRKEWSGLLVCRECWEPKPVELQKRRTKPCGMGGGGGFGGPGGGTGSEFNTLDLLCTLDGRSAVTGLAVAGCSIVETEVGEIPIPSGTFNPNTL